MSGHKGPVFICEGTCGRLTRPSVSTVEDYPDTEVSRAINGYCRECWNHKEATRPFTPRELEAIRTLEIFLTKRRVRLAKGKTELEQFRKKPLFNSLDVTQDIRDKQQWLADSRKEGYLGRNGEQAKDQAQAS